MRDILPGETIRRRQRMEIRRKNTAHTLELVEYENEDGSVLPVLEFPALRETGLVNHFFTTREGGVSDGVYRSMNLSFYRGDDREKVHENYQRVARALGTDEKHMVLTCQAHHTNVRRVTMEDAGKGTVRKRDWDDLDGLVTNEPGLALGTFFADCVPLMFVDPVHRAIGACHSGWRGTVGKIGTCTLKKMQQEFGTHAEDVLCAIGPSICGDCYEVSDDVAEQFQAAFPGQGSRILRDEHNGHQMLDLWAACRLTLLEAGALPEHIVVTDLCTFENPELLFSHRASHGQHGNFGGFIMLK